MTVSLISIQQIVGLSSMIALTHNTIKSCSEIVLDNIYGDEANNLVAEEF